MNDAATSRDGARMALLTPDDYAGRAQEAVAASGHVDPTAQVWATLAVAAAIERANGRVWTDDPASHSEPEAASA